MSEYGPSEAELFGETHHNSNSDTVAEHSEQDTESELLRKIESVDSTRFIFECLESKITTYDENARWPVVIDRDRLQSMLEHYEDRVDAHWKQAEETPTVPIELPEDFDKNKAARQGLRDALDILYRHDIVERDWLVEASKIAGPGNTEGVDIKFAAPGGHIIRGLLNWGKYVEDLRSKGWNSTKILPMPHSKADRNEMLNIQLNFEPDALSDNVSGLRDAAEASDKPLSNEELVQLETLIIAAHEYGHALDLAFGAHGASTLEAAKTLEALPMANVLPELNLEEINRELFARAFEQAVLNLALQERFNYSKEQVERFNLHRYDQTEAQAEAFKALFEYAPQLGVRQLDVMSVMYQMQSRVRSLKGDRFMVLMPDVYMILKYMHKPYTLEQIKTMQPTLPEDRDSVRRQLPR